MRVSFLLLGAALAALAAPAALHAADAPQTPKTRPDDGPAGAYFAPEQAQSEGSVTVGGQRIDYQAVIGTLVVHAHGFDDAPQKPLKDSDTDHGHDGHEADHDGKNPTAEAAMSYVAYFKKGAPESGRPIMFLYNGGPGSSTVWLHMGAFGPRRVVTPDDSHAPAAPYQLVANQYSLLDVTDLVFIDAPGTGFGRIAGPDKEKAFWGVDADAHAFGDFVVNFLTRYSRWNSPKYLFGESYGTTRNAVLVNELETERALDVNGVVMLSQILNWDLSPDQPELNPGMDLPYELALPTYAATAWYHHKLDPRQDDLQTLLIQAEDFANTDYAQMLRYGATLPPSDRKATIERLHDFTGLPEKYLDQADLRVNGPEFEKQLLGADTTTGRLDTRFAGPTLDPLSKAADYDPQSAAISSAYVTAFNDYARHDLKLTVDRPFHVFADVGKFWNFQHTPPGASEPQSAGALNVMPDLANAMKYNPQLKVLINGGVYDLATPYFAAIWEAHHLPIPPRLEGNLLFARYESGHMVYAHEPDLKKLHDNVAKFVTMTDNVKQ